MMHVRNVRRSVEFYEKLGFRVGNTHTPEGGVEPVWAWLESGGAHLMLAQAGEPVDAEKPAVLFYVYSADVDAFRSMLLEAWTLVRFTIPSTPPEGSSASPILTATF